MIIFPSKDNILLNSNPVYWEDKVSVTFYRKLCQNLTIESCISNTFCSTTYKLHNTVYILHTTGHDILVKLFRLKNPSKFSTHMILMKFGQDVANQILHLTISATSLCYRIFAGIIGNPKKTPKRPFLNLALYRNKNF